MARFRNDSHLDVYVDLGKLILVRPGQVVDLEGALSCPPLTMLMDVPPTLSPKTKKKVPRKSKSSDTSGTI